MYNFKTKEEFNTEFDFNNGIFLGKGGFGEVKKCKSNFDNQSNKDYAIKIMQNTLG